MYTDLYGKTAVVTGASKGIGEAVALRFGQERMKVVLAYYSDERQVERTVRAIRQAGGEAIAVRADVGREEEVQRLIGAAERHYGDIHVMVNNAGIQSAFPSHELSLEEWNRVLNVNLTGAFLGCREALRHMLERGVRGCLINISSVHQAIPKPLHAHYASSKGGLKLLTETLALEYAARGIRINAIAPGAIRTPMNERLLNDPDRTGQVLTRIPMGRFGEPEQVAAAAAWLASEESGYVTGIALFADGGMTLGPAG